MRIYAARDKRSLTVAARNANVGQALSPAGSRLSAILSRLPTVAAPFRASGVLFLAVTAVTPGFTQQAPPEDPGVVIRSTTSLVEVRVVAIDSKGNAVVNLERGDFQILDDRKPQPITLFTADRSALPVPKPVSPSARPQQDTVAASGYSLLLLDWINTPYFDRLRAQENAIRLLQKFQPRQRVAVFLMGHEPRLLHDFTTDMPELVQAIEDAGLEPGEVELGPGGRFDASNGWRVGRQPGVEEQLFFLNRRIIDTFQIMERVAARLVHVPGRKSLIWVSNSFPIVIDGGVVRGAKTGELFYQQNLQKLLASLNRADVAVYPVDAAGLTVQSRSYKGTMRDLAERTGGTAFYDRNDLDEGMRLAFEDLRLSYTLGFHVPPGDAPGIHEIRVKVNRPGVKLRYRESYQLGEAGAK